MMMRTRLWACLSLGLAVAGLSLSACATPIQPPAVAAPSPAMAALDAAAAVLSVTTIPTVSTHSDEATTLLRAYVNANRRHQAAKPVGSPANAADYRRRMDDWLAQEKNVNKAAEDWNGKRKAFIAAAREQLRTIG